MSTLTPTEAGGARQLMRAAQSEPSPHAALVPRSVRHSMGSDALQPASLLNSSTYEHINIAIPMGTQSSVLMEVSHDGKVMDLVARFESISEFEGSDTSEASAIGDRTRASSMATIRPDDSDVETVCGSSVSTTAVVDEAMSSPNASKNSMRKPIPQEWAPPTAYRGAPRLQTELRGLEREKKRAVQANTPTKLLRGTRSSADLKKPTFLTKEKAESIATSPLSPSSPSSPRLRRNESKASFGPVRSPPVRTTAGPNVQITVSPSKTAVTAAAAACVRTPSVISSGDTEFHSARHSPVSMTTSQAPSSVYHSPTYTYIAIDSEDDIPSMILTGADNNEQKTSDGTNSIKGHQLRLSLKIPPMPMSTRPPFHLGSASSSGSGSPTRSTSRIPRMNTSTKTMEKSATMSRTQLNKSDTLKRSAMKAPHEVPLPLTPLVPARHVRTLNSSGTTPIITQESLASNHAQPDNHTMVTSYLENIESVSQAEQTPFTEELAATSDICKAVAKVLSDSAFVKPAFTDSSKVSRATSLSIVKATPLEDPALEDSAVIYSRKKSVDSEDNPEPQSSASVDELVVVPSKPPARGRGEEFIPKKREQTRSQHSLRSTASSDLRATAPDFIPAGTMLGPANNILPFNPFGLDAYGIPWLYYMYPFHAPMMRPFSFGKSPMKSKTIPRSWKRRDSSVTSPKKVLKVLEKFAAQIDEDPSATSSIPFAAQLDEITRSAEARKAKIESRGPQDTSSIGPQTMPIRSSPASGVQTVPARCYIDNRSYNRRNGLFDYDRAHARSRLQVGIPIDQTAPFPSPIPPSGRKEYIGYSFKKSKGNEHCGVVNVEKGDASEWGGKACNTCEPDH